MTTQDPKRTTKQNIIDRLVENNVKLQQVNTNLLISVDNMTKKVDELVQIFKKAAEHIEKGEIKEPLARKLVDLLEQNKRIAKGLILMEKFMKEKEGYPQEKKEEYQDLF